MGNFHFIRTAAIVSTGTEILQGMYPDTNAQWLAQQLCALGIRVTAMTQSPDEGACVDAAVRFAASRADLVICSGGLGPTADDLNRDILANAGGSCLQCDDRVLEMIRARFAARGRDVPPGNDCQARVPEGAQILYNNWGTAPGWFLPPATERGCSCDGAVQAAILALPGPPSELKPMFTQCALPVLHSRIEGGAKCTRTRTLHVYGYPESTIGQFVEPFFHLRDDVIFTILARAMGIELRITAIADTPQNVDSLIAEVETQVRAAVPADAVFGADSDTLASVTGDLLRKHALTVTTAESCTGGLIAKMLTDVAGSSTYFREGHVTYANDVKERVLGVRHETLLNHGAVSEQTALEMAHGARHISGADYALAVTGVAGPDGGTETKPVGLVYIALAGPKGNIALKHTYLFDRESNRNHAALTALNMLRLELLK